LNELYKPVIGPRGDIASNPGAEPEELAGVETSWLYQPGSGAQVGVTLYRTEVKGLIQNVTLGEAGELPELIEPCGLLEPGRSCRQRQNVGKMRSEGLELSAQWRSRRGFRPYLNGVLLDAKIVSAPAQPQLVGKRVRLAPEWVLSAGLSGPLTSRSSFDVSYRWLSDRYDDDLERTYVGELKSLDLSAVWQVREGLDLTLKVVNLLDRNNPVAVSAGLPEVGPPRLLAAGLRWSRFGGSHAGGATR
jgi:outer membrane receptor protein involved in Fe transport